MYIVLCHISKSLHSEKKNVWQFTIQCVWSVHLYSLYYMWTRAVASAHKCSQWTLRSREYKFNRWALFNRFSGLTSFILRTLLGYLLHIIYLFFSRTCFMEIKKDIFILLSLSNYSFWDRFLHSCLQQETKPLHNRR